MKEMAAVISLAVLFIAGCSGRGEERFVGNWRHARDPEVMLTITAHGDVFTIEGKGEVRGGFAAHGMSVDFNGILRGKEKDGDLAINDLQKLMLVDSDHIDFMGERFERVPR